MESPNQHPPDYDYDEYPEYAGNMGLPASQLALIIGVNAVISLIISVMVVLAVNWQSAPTVAVQPTDTGQVAESQPAQVTAVEIAADTQPTSTPGNTIYRVQNGDALSSIASKFEVSVYDLMIANGLTNEDFIQVDQELIIPIGGLPTATPTFTPVPPTPTEAIAFDPPTPIPNGAEQPATTLGTTPPLTESVAPSEAPESAPPTVMPTPTDRPFTGIVITINDIAGVGDINLERISITNQGTGTSLKTWTLEGSPIGVFSFPDIFLFSGGTIRIHTRSGQSSPSDLFLNQTTSAWPPGSIITLKDDTGVEVAQFTVPGS